MMEIGARYGSPTLPIQQLGPLFFRLFSAIAFFTALAAGWFFATDAIAHERREGTLELLFLAPLKPWVVVLGKFVTVMWRGIQWLLAAVPLFALPILLGSVSGDDFVRLACLAGNTLFWSVTTSLWASSRSRGIFEALVATAILQSTLMVIPFVVDLGIAGFNPIHFKSHVSLLSPIGTWVHGFSTNTGEYWTSFALVHTEAWILLALTIRGTARQIRQDPSVSSSSVFGRLNNLWKYGRPRAREALRSRLIELHPIRWLVERERGPIRFLTALPLVIVLSVAGISLAIGDPTALFVVGTLGGFVLGVAVTTLLALQASRFLVEARRTGSLELLLVSPLSTRAILSEQCRSLLRTFALPVGVLLASQIVLAVGQMQLTAGAAAIPPPAASGPGVSATAAMIDMARFQWLNLATGVLVSLTGYAAVAWVGLWMGLACRQITLALFATLAISKLAPMLVGSFAQTSLLPLVFSQRVPGWFPAVIAGVVGVAVNLGLIYFARHQLLPDLRRIVDSPTSVLWPAIPRRRPQAPPILDH